MVFNHLNQLFKAMLDKSVRVELLETNTLQIKNYKWLRQAQPERRVLFSIALKKKSMGDPSYIGVSKGG
jgi:hypothetical protein